MLYVYQKWASIWGWVIKMPVKVLTAWRGQGAGTNWGVCTTDIAVWPPPFILKVFLVSHKWKSPVPGWLCAFHQWARFITPSSDLFSDLPLATKIWLHLHQGRKNSVWHVKLWLTQSEPISDFMAHWNSLARWYHKTMDVFSLTCPQRSP